MPGLRTSGVTEAVLYVDDLVRATDFYAALLGCPVIRREERFAALRTAPEQVLLLFLRGAALQPTALPGGLVPAHDGHGPAHLCFGISAAEIPAWEARLRAMHIAVESRVVWPSGAQSLYFRDAENHAIELATPGVWAP